MTRRHLIDGLETRLCLHGDVDITFNFQPRESGVPAGTVADLGYAFGDRGDGLRYGWNVDNRGNTRDRNKTSDQKLDTLIQMQAGGNFTWELEIANGQYEVTIGSGDAKYLDGEHHITAEGAMVMYGVQSTKKRYLKVTKTITVNDGRLTLAPGPAGVNTKIQYVRVRSYHETPHDVPAVSITAPIDFAKEGGPDGLFRVTRSIVTNEPLTVSLGWSGSGGSRKDLVGTPGTVTIPANQASVDIPVVAIDDALDEALETAKVTILAGAGYTTGSPATASVFIDGSEAPPEPTAADVSIAVIDGTATEGGGNGLVRLTRSGGVVAQTLTVNLVWSGSAGAGDIVSRPGTATFAANATTLDVVVAAVDDSLVEATETAIVTIGSGSGYNVVSGSGSASVSILDNDEPDESFTSLTWSAATAPPISFAESTSVVVDGKLYLFGGFNGTFVPQSKVYRFDGTSWTTLNDAPVAFTHVGSAVADGKVWIAGGYLGNGMGGQIFGTTMVKIYDPSDDTWSDGPALPQARAAGNLVKIGRSLYFFGGENFNRTADTPEMWALDLDNQGTGWVTKASMPMARTHAAAVVVDNKIISLGGQTGYDGGLTAHDDIQIYDVATNTWSVASQTLPGNNSHAWHSTIYHRGRIIMVTGESAHNVPINSVWSIDPTTFSVTTLGNFPDARFSTAGGVINDKLYLFGGYAGYIPTTGYVGTFA